MNDAVVITGHRGGLGQALARGLTEAGYQVIGIDLEKDPDAGFPQLAADLGTLCDDAAQESLFKQISSILPGQQLRALINNAAVQVVEPLATISGPELIHSFIVNAAAPAVLGQLLLEALERGKGSIINISSIHARQTKSRFGAYSISKSALSGVSRAMAIEWGSRVRVIELRPAAIATDMLEAGFKGHTEARRSLDSYHPTGKIGKPQEIARIVQELIELDSDFLNGAVVNVDGGISHVLHDPDI